MENNKVDVLKTDEVVEAYIDSVFDKNDTLPSSDDNAKFSVSFCKNAMIDLSPKEYQREKVATYAWKVELIKTLLVHMLTYLFQKHIS